MTDCVLYQHSLDYRLLYLCIAIINTYEYTDIKLECFTWLRRKESNFRRFILFSIFTVTYSNESIMLSSYSFEVITFNAQSKLFCTGQTVKFLQMRQQWQQNIIMKKNPDDNDDRNNNQARRICNQSKKTLHISGLAFNDFYRQWMKI